MRAARSLPAKRAASALFGAGGQAYCVRTCDGRYFPINASDNQSRAAACNNFCPASDTKIVYGSSIDAAATETGKPYSELPNAFRYRNEMVAGCTCNGKDQVGLAPVKIENDPTLRKGDIVAGEGGLVVANRGADKRGALAELLAGLGKAARALSSVSRWWRGNNPCKAGHAGAVIRSFATACQILKLSGSVIGTFASPRAF